MQRHAKSTVTLTNVPLVNTAMPMERVPTGMRRFRRRGRVQKVFTMPVMAAIADVGRTIPIARFAKPRYSGATKWGHIVHSRVSV